MPKDTVKPQTKTLKVKPGFEKLRVSMKGYKGFLGTMTQEQLKQYFEIYRGKTNAVIEA